MRENMRLIQRGLIGLGLDPGPVDGLWGPKTKAAITALLARSEAPPKAAVASPAPSTRPMVYQGAARHPVREIVVHCSDTAPDWYQGMSAQAKRGEIRRWHVQENGWRDIGYHWLIDRDGTLLTGRLETEIGAGVAGHNQGVIHICLIGGRGGNERDRFSKHFTPAQDRTVRDLIDAIGMRTQVQRVSGHNEHAAKACPCFNVKTWLKET